MARGNKNLAAGYEDVATTSNTNTNQIIDNDTNISTNNDTDNDINTNDNNDNNIENGIIINDSIKSIASSIMEKPKSIKKRQISCYIDEDIAKDLDKFGKKYGKGAKSELINNFLKTFFEK